MARRRTKKLVHKAEFLREEYLEAQEIHDDAKIDFYSKIREIQSDLNVYDADLDGGYQESSDKKAPASDDQKNPDSDPVDPTKPGELDNYENSKAGEKHPPWVKSLYRKISIKSHPDKLLNATDDEKKEKTELYGRASKSYADHDYASLVMVAVDLKVSLPEIDQIAKILKEKCESYLSDIKSIKSSLFWVWSCSSDEQKHQILGDFIKERGWTDPRAAMKKSRNKNHPGKSIAWARKRFGSQADEV